MDIKREVSGHAFLLGWTHAVLEIAIFFSSSMVGVKRVYGSLQSKAPALYSDETTKHVVHKGPHKHSSRHNFPLRRSERKAQTCANA
jgi:hypothetical protein